MAQWVIQRFVYSPSDEMRIADALQRLDCRAWFVELARGQKTMPDELAQELSLIEPIVILGGNTLRAMSKAGAWRPGYWLNHNFDFVCWRLPLDNALLNAEAELMRLDEVPKADAWFVRPVSDSKQFTGRVFAWAEFEAFRAGEIAAGRLSPSEFVVVGAVKTILREFRFFVVNRRIVSSTPYRMGGSPNQAGPVDDDAIALVKRVIAKWVPCPAFVVDVASTPDGPRVVEFNGINSAAFYGGDVLAVLNALNELAERRSVRDR